jgi:L,D-peptidoglycan transpeptidase YkuD (ErfK/YbiS/YcfS/YnhG family)
VERPTRRDPYDGDRSVHVFVGAIAALVLLTVVVVAIASMRPYTNEKVRVASSSQNVEPPPQPKPAVVAASPTPAPEPAPPAKPATNAAPRKETRAATSKPAAAPKPSKPKPSAPKTMPEQMAGVPSGSRQIIVITGSKIGSNSGTLAVYNKDNGHWVRVMSTHAAFGKNGLVDGVKRTSGHLQTPTGIWTIGRFLFGQHAAVPSGTKMPYRHITSNSWWSAEHDSTYNTWVTSKSSVNGEHLINAQVQYEYAFDTGYNAPPNQRVIGRGTAIFIHCSEPPGNSLGEFTHGCVAIDRDKMIELFRLLDPARKPVSAIGTLQKGSATSIWAY